MLGQGKTCGVIQNVMISTLDMSNPIDKNACDMALKYAKQCCSKVDRPAPPLMKCKDAPLDAICASGSIDAVNAETECPETGCDFRTCCKPPPSTLAPTEEPTLEPEVARCNLCPDGAAILADKIVSPPFKGAALCLSFSECV